MFHTHRFVIPAEVSDVAMLLAVQVELGFPATICLQPLLI